MFWRRLKDVLEEGKLLHWRGLEDKSRRRLGDQMFAGKPLTMVPTGGLPQAYCQPYHKNNSSSSWSQFKRWKMFTAWKVSKYRAFSGPYFPAFGLNMCGKIWTIKNSVFGHFSRSGYCGHHQDTVSWHLTNILT